MRVRHGLVGLSLLAFTALSQDSVDLNVIYGIRQEAFQNSKVMNHMFQLTDVSGPRLTNSPGFWAAADWAVKQLKEYGLENVKLEKWGPYGRGWSYSKFQAHMITPVYAPLAGFPLAYSPGTGGGPVSGEVVEAVLANDADLERFKGKLQGKIILTSVFREVAMNAGPLGRRFTDADLAGNFTAPIPATTGIATSVLPAAGRGGRGGAAGGQSAFLNRRNLFLKQEGVVALISGGTRGDNGLVFGQSGGSYNEAYADSPPNIVIEVESYNRLLRLVAAKIPVKVQLEVETQFQAESKDSANVIAELPGGSKRNEVVMIGAHLDSWHGGTGATDNAAGSAVMIEVMRILKTLNLKPDRTIRLALWSGEEQGLLGSKAYVKEHFADLETMKTTEEHARLSGYFNMDNGTGKIRGVYLQGNEMVRPIFETWMAPFKDVGMTTLTIRNTTGTDHLSLDNAGLPGFQFIQDPIEYDTRTHHSNMDVLDRIQPADLRQAAAIIASFAYNTAMRPQLLPRKPLPKPTPRPAQPPAQNEGLTAPPAVTN